MISQKKILVYKRALLFAQAGTVVATGLTKPDVMQEQAPLSLLTLDKPDVKQTPADLLLLQFCQIAPSQISTQSTLGQSESCMQR